jgi:hypothetical protein
MPRKSKASTTKPRRPGRSLSEGPTATQRLAALEARAAARGYRPMTAAEFDRFLDDHRDLWPDAAEVDAFVSWLHRSRRKGHFD